MNQAFCFLSLVFFIQTLSAQWELISEGLGIDLIHVQFVSEQVGWISGYGTLLRTVDGGESWTSRNPNQEDWYLEYFRFSNDNLGWANGYWSNEVTERRSLLKTTDGGNTWSPVYNLPAYYYCQDIAVVDESTVFVVGNIIEPEHCTGFVLKTMNGGNSWQVISPPSPLNKVDLNQVHFIDKNKVIATGNCDTITVILKTFDGGLSWSRQEFPSLRYIDQLQLINDSTAWFISRNLNYENILCFTADTFQTWTVRQPPGKSTNTFFAHPGGHTVFTASQDSMSSFIMKSSSAGLSWEMKQEIWARNFTLNNPFNWPRYGQSTALNTTDMVFSSGNTGFLMGTNVIYSSTDAGESWELQTVDLPVTGLQLISEDLLLISTSSSGGGHSVGSGILFGYNLSDNKWLQLHEISGWISSMDFYNDKGIVITDFPGIFMTENNGTTWTQIFGDNFDSVGYWFFGSSIAFIDDQKIRAVGNYSDDFSYGAAILGSEDGGMNWDLTWKYPDPNTNDEYYYQLNDMIVIGFEMWAVGESGMIVKSSAPDSFTIVPSETKLPLHSVFFVDKQHGWISGGYFYPWGDEDIQSILLKTVNGGATWQESRYYEYLINDMYFEDKLHGWAIGVDTSNKGIILESSDGGENWEVQVSGLSAPLNILHAKYSQLWAGGNNGMLLKLDGVSRIDPPTENPGIDGPFLLQCYPNPFSEILTIGFTLTSNEIVKLTIYDRMGREITQLINRNMHEGNHQIKWNTRDNSGITVPEGIYFMQLSTGSFIETCKVIFAE